MRDARSPRLLVKEFVGERASGLLVKAYTGVSRPGEYVGSSMYILSKYTIINVSFLPGLRRG